MILVYPEQLESKLQKKLHLCYMLFGDDQLLLQESEERICTYAKALQFNEYISITLNTNPDWEAIYSTCQTLSLFSNRKILLLVMPENGINAATGEKLSMLAPMLNDEIMLILRGNKLTRALENSTWFKILSQNAVLVNCTTPEYTQLPHWVAARAKNMNLMLDDVVCQLLCQYYEGNLLALTQALKRLSLIYPDGNLPLPRVEAAINNASSFTILHWIDAILAGKSERANHILQQLQLKANNPVVLLRSIQREVLLLITIKRQIIAEIPVKVNTLFDRYKVLQKRRTLLTQALQRLNLQQLYQSVTLMVKMELAIKQEYIYAAWPDITTLTLLLCGESLPIAILDG